MKKPLNILHLRGSKKLRGKTNVLSELKRKNIKTIPRNYMD